MQVAFGAAFAIAYTLHFESVVKNQHWRYPEASPSMTWRLMPLQEWMPSVSATIGDFHPERNLFQLLIAATAGMPSVIHCDTQGPRFGILIAKHCWYARILPCQTGKLTMLNVMRVLLAGSWMLGT
jgi:hypothetical protein